MKTPSEATRVSSAVNTVEKVMTVAVPALPGSSTEACTAGSSFPAAPAHRQDRLRRAARVIMLTTFDLDKYVYAALTAGASGFLLKDVTPAHLAAAVRLVDTGDAPLSPGTRRPAPMSSAFPTTAEGVPEHPQHT
ncbi:hypothetical protein ACFVYP_05060 [Kitasatospora sp. NPDC058201]|uniref:hypothetical protein n=1 Tax=unclassified Kitasatospora TaxID=2633591 RepID=UPI0036661B0C